MKKLRSFNLKSNNFNYVVTSNDTLSSIANKFNTTVYHLIKLNDLSSNIDIYTGQILKVFPSSTYKLYTVKKGDTLSSIASKFNTTIYHISKLNDIFDPNHIYPGQTLKL